MQKEYEKGKAEATKEIERENEHKMALLLKDHENITNRLNDKVDALNTEISKCNKLNAQLQDKLDNAYVEIKELATKAVESANGVKIIGNNTNEGK